MAAKSQPAMPGVVRRQLHVLLLLDCSGSMQGDRIASLNYAIRTAIPALRGAARENPEIEVYLRALRYSSGAQWHIGEPTLVEDLHWQDLTAGGETDFGEALVVLSDMLEAGIGPGRQLPPVILLATDGFPTDLYQQPLARFLALPVAQSAVRLAIGIGADADQGMLREFIADDRLRPLQASNASELVHYISWATTAPVKATSSPSNSPDGIAEMMDGAEILDTPESDIVW